MPGCPEDTCTCITDRLHFLAKRSFLHNFHCFFFSENEKTKNKNNLILNSQHMCQCRQLSHLVCVNCVGVKTLFHNYNTLQLGGNKTNDTNIYFLIMARFHDSGFFSKSI